MNNRIKTLIATAVLTFVGVISATAQTNANNNLLVTMPTPPESLERLDQRCNYIIENYWKTFNPKSSFSSMEKLNNTLGTFFSFTPYASADTVHLAIDRLIEAVGKADPENLLTLAQLAAGWTYADTAEYQSDELYFPFVRAVALNKKAKGSERVRYVHQYKQLENSMIGSTATDLELTLADGSHKRLSEIATPHVLYVFYDPDCTDCSIAKTRLDADYTLGALIRKGFLSIVAIYPGEADDAWKGSAAGMPSAWTVGASPEADEVFTIDRQPTIYYLDENRRILAKSIPVDNVLNAFHSVTTTMVKPIQGSDNTAAGVAKEGE